MGCFAVKFVQLFFVVFLVTGMILPTYFYVAQEETPDINNQVVEISPSQCLSQDAIRIRNNAELAAYASLGVGTENDPYFISNLHISIIDEEVAFVISNTDAHFLLTECQIFVEQGFAAILMSNVSNGKIKDCEISGAGIMVESSNCCEIVDCSITNAALEAGIGISVSGNIMVSGNTITNSPSGIFLLMSENIWVSSNQNLDCASLGIDIYLSSNTTLHHNVLINNGVFLSLWSAGNANQTFEGSQYISVNYNFESNLVNGKPLGFFHHITDDTIDGDNYGQLILLNCTDVTINGGNFSNASVGCQLHFSNNCTIKGASITNNNFWGMYIHESNSSRVDICYVNDNFRDGIFIEKSNHTQIINSLIANSDRSGLSFHTSNECFIQNNSLTHNVNGIILDSSSNCTIVDNEILHNLLIGIRILGASRENVVYGNDIGWNIGANAIDDSGYNLWDNGVDLGNCWSDYFGFGLYHIPSYGVDHYPSFLGNPLLCPAILIQLGIVSILLILTAGVLIRRKRRLLADHIVLE